MLEGLVGLFLPSPVDKAKAAVKPNPYAPRLSTQFNVAVGQHVRRGITGGLSGLTGSEADYEAEQSRGNAALGGPLHQFIPDAAQPPSRFRPRLPDQVEGHGTGPQTGAYNKGFVTLDRDERTRWGGTVHRFQSVINGVLLNPRDRAPLPRDAQEAYNRNNPNGLRLEDQYGSNS